MNFVLDDIIDRFWKHGRIRQFEEYAARHDFAFKDRERMDQQTYEIQEFDVFSGKKAKRLKGILTKRFGDVYLRIYDYFYYVDGERQKSTIFEAYDPTLQLPRFLIRPKRSIKWVKEVFVRENWFFPDAAAFHAYYEIDGPDHLAIAEYLTADLVDLVASSQHIRVEGEGAYLLVYQRRKQIQIRSIAEMIDFTLDLVESLGAPSSEPPLSDLV